MTTALRWLFGDQLGPWFHDDAAGDVVLIESRTAFRRRSYHRRKAHLVLSALRHRAAELGDRAHLVHADTYRDGVEQVEGLLGPVSWSVCEPTSYGARRLVRRLGKDHDLTVLPERGWVVDPEEFRRWTEGRGHRRLLLEDFYRTVRRSTGLLVEMDGGPVGGRWNLDAENRLPPPRGARRLADTVPVGEPWWPQEDAIDAEVRAELDRWTADGDVTLVGQDGPRRFPVTRTEALAALERFVEERLAAFGPYEDAVMAGDRWMAHSLLSVPLNLGLLHPLEVAERAVRAYHDGVAPLSAVEGFVRQVVGWREYVWHLYWFLGEDYRDRNALDAHVALPAWWEDLDADGTVTARCLADALAGVREEGWTHHIPRLMVLGNHALQRGYDPQALTEWFRRTFVDGYDWVMVPNVVGMSQHADGGVMATKPYVSGGAYLDRMTDHCRECPFDPRSRLGPRACPFTAGYWAFVHRHREMLRRSPRTARALAGLDRLTDLEAVLEQEARRDTF